MGKPGFVKMMRTECKPARTAGWRRPHPGPCLDKARLHPAGRRWLIILVLVLGATGVARAEPLPGRIWKPAEARFVDPGEVIAAARAAPFVLLGETHTVARHHALQARLIRAIAENGRQPAIVLEMVARDRQGDIDAWRRADAPDAVAFGAAVEWRERGWPPWSAYRPIVEAALAHGLPVRAGGPASDLSGRVAEAGLAALADRTEETFPGLETPLDAAAERRLLDTLTRAHCGLPEHAPVDRMIAVQRLRDAAMAHTMLEADSASGAVLIAGRGHVRRDYGVPVYLQRGAPERDFVTVAFLGTANRPTIADQREAAGGTLPFDYVWFTEGGAAGPDCSADRSGTPGK